MLPNLKCLKRRQSKKVWVHTKVQAKVEALGKMVEAKADESERGRNPISKLIG